MNRKNPAKESFLRSIPSITIESARDRFLFTAFSFQFFDSSQDAGQNFSDWTHEQLYKLLDKLKAYCQNTIEHWCRMPVGHGVSHVLEIYGNFPAKSDFTFPKHIPIDVSWGRFRLEKDMRLIGFIINHENCCKFGLSKNIFYVVFLDQNHRFFLK
jgi:hypothetical protein